MGITAEAQRTQSERIVVGSASAAIKTSVYRWERVPSIQEISPFGRDDGKELVEMTIRV